MDDNAKAVNRVWTQLSGKLSPVFLRPSWQSFQLADDYHDFQQKAEVVRQAIGLAVGCHMSRTFVLSVKGSQESERVELSCQVARLVSLEGIAARDGLYQLVQAEWDSKPQGLTCKELFDLMLSRAEGDQPLYQLYLGLGKDLARLQLTAQTCVDVWGPMVRESGMALAYAIAQAMLAYQVELRRAAREHYAPEEELHEDAVPTTVKSMLDAWWKEEPARRDYPDEPPKFALPKRKEDFQVAYDEYTIRLEQYDTYLAALQSFEDRLEVKAAEGGHAPPQRYPDEHRRLQAEDACRQLAGGGMADWIHLDGPMNMFKPRNTESPTLTKRGWRAVFRMCVPPEYAHVFQDRTFISVKGWTDVLEGYLRLEEKKRAPPKSGASVKPPTTVSKSRAAKTTSETTVLDGMAQDRFLGVHRHYIDPSAFKEYAKVRGAQNQLRWLQTHLETQSLPPKVKAAVKEGYRKRLADLASPTSPSPKKASQSSFRHSRPQRAQKRQDYSWEGQRAAHEGVHVVESNDDSDEGTKTETKRPATPHPYRPADSDSDMEHDPLYVDTHDPLYVETFDFLDHRAHTPEPWEEDQGRRMESHDYVHRQF